jgi:beta-lactamase regulating signal transducer with metallopeptidase domain
MLCILYVIVITTALGAAAFLAERALPAHRPRRGLWCVVIALSRIVPPVFQARHAVTITTLLPAQHGAPGQAGGAIGALPMLDAEWWLETASPGQIVNRLWISASLLLLAWGAMDVLRVRRVLGGARARSHPADSVDGVPVRNAEGLGPATDGVSRPRIVISSWELARPAQERRYVIRHEQEHQRSRDGLLLLFAATALVLTPWNLPLYWVLRRLRIALELDCDQRVVRALGEPAAYAAVLLDAAEATRRHPAGQLAVLGAAHSLEHRLVTLVAPKRAGWGSRVAAPLVAALLLLAALLLPHPVLPAHAPVGDRHRVATPE